MLCDLCHQNKEVVQLLPQYYILRSLADEGATYRVCEECAERYGILPKWTRIRDMNRFINKVKEDNHASMGRRGS